MPAASSRFRFSMSTFLEALGIKRVSAPKRTGLRRMAYKIVKDHFPLKISLTCPRRSGWQTESRIGFEVSLSTFLTATYDLWGCSRRVPHIGDTLLILLIGSQTLLFLSPVAQVHQLELSGHC